MGNERRWVFEVAHQARNVAHEDEPLGSQGDRHLRRGHVRIAVIDLAILTASGWTDDRGDALFDAARQRGDVDPDDFPDKANVELLASRSCEPTFSTGENFRA